MIQDITKIREELEGYIEVKLPYEFPRDVHIKYLTLKNKADESFYPGGCYQGVGNNCIFLSNSYKRWSVPLYFYTKEGEVRYSTRFFVPEDISGEVGESSEMYERLHYQQEIIEKMIQEIKTTRHEMQRLTEEKKTCEEMLQGTRDRFKELVNSVRDRDTQIQKYKDIVQKLSQSHPLMTR